MHQFHAIRIDPAGGSQVIVKLQCHQFDQLIFTVQTFDPNILESGIGEAALIFFCFAALGGIDVHVAQELITSAAGCTVTGIKHAYIRTQLGGTVFVQSLAEADADLLPGAQVSQLDPGSSGNALTHIKQECVFSKRTHPHGVVFRYCLHGGIGLRYQGGKSFVCAGFYRIEPVLGIVCGAPTVDLQSGIIPFTVLQVVIHQGRGGAAPIFVRADDFCSAIRICQLENDHQSRNIRKQCSPGITVVRTVAHAHADHILALLQKRQQVKALVLLGVVCAKGNKTGIADPLSVEIWLVAS